MADEHPRLTFNDLFTHPLQSDAERRAAIIAAMGGAQSKRAREYVALLDTLNERLARK
jgi:hypothetical protein